MNWTYSTEIGSISSPYSHFPRKTSNQITKWKTKIANSAVLRGFNETNVYIHDRPFFAQNLENHIALNGISHCRDIRIVFDQEHEECVDYAPEDILEVVRVTKHHRIPQLNGQFAVRALRNIPKHTVIGRFCGDEMFKFEYKELFLNSCEYRMRNQYRMTMQCPHDRWSGEQCIFGEIILDELDTFPANPMVIMNDVRRNLTQKGGTLSDEDEEHWNCQFSHALVNGWPLLYVVTRKDILKGQELATYYGPRYC